MDEGLEFDGGIGVPGRDPRKEGDPDPLKGSHNLLKERRIGRWRRPRIAANRLDQRSDKDGVWHLRNGRHGRKDNGRVR